MQSEQPQGQVHIKSLTAVSVGDDNVKVSFFPSHFNLPNNQSGNTEVLKYSFSPSVLGEMCSFILHPDRVPSKQYLQCTKFFLFSFFFFLTASLNYKEKIWIMILTSFFCLNRMREFEQNVSELLCTIILANMSCLVTVTCNLQVICKHKWDQKAWFRNF